MKLEFSSLSKMHSVQPGDLLLDRERSIISVYKGSYIYNLVEYSSRYEDFFRCVYNIDCKKWNSEVLADDSNVVGNIKGTKVYSKVFVYMRNKYPLNPFTRNLILDTVTNSITDSSKFFHNETNRSH